MSLMLLVVRIAKIEQVLHWSRRLPARKYRFTPHLFSKFQHGHFSVLRSAFSLASHYPDGGSGWRHGFHEARVGAGV